MSKPNLAVIKDSVEKKIMLYFLCFHPTGKEQGDNILSNMDHGGDDNGQSQWFIQDAVLCMGEMVQASILADIKMSPFYSLLIDETTDISFVSEMFVYAR